MILEVLSNLVDFMRNKKLNFLRLLLLQIGITWQVVVIRNKLDLNIIIRSLSHDCQYNASQLVGEGIGNISQCVDLYPGLSCCLFSCKSFPKCKKAV